MSVGTWLRGCSYETKNERSKTAWERTHLRRIVQCVSVVLSQFCPKGIENNGRWITLDLECM